jgi:hypothetical protein
MSIVRVRSHRRVLYLWPCLALYSALASCGSSSGSGSDTSGTESNPPTAAVQISVHADRTQANTLAWGLLHGLTRAQLGTANPTPLIRAVQPKTWRMANHGNDVYGYVVSDAQFPATDGTQIVWNVQDSFMMAQGGSSSTRFCVGAVACPTADALKFASFAELRTSWNNFLSNFLATAPAFDWYDIFAEPDLQVFGLSVPDDLVTLYLDAEAAIRARYPQAQLVVPSYGSFSDGTDNRLVAFVTASKSRGGTPNAIAWARVRRPSGPGRGARGGGKNDRVHTGVSRAAHQRIRIRPLYPMARASRRLAPLSPGRGDPIRPIAPAGTCRSRVARRPAAAGPPSTACSTIRIRRPSRSTGCTSATPA